MQSSQSYGELVATTVQYLQVSTVYDGGFLRPETDPATLDANPNPNAMDG